MIYAYEDNYQRKDYSVAIYCRISNEDGEKIESNSIANQREILIEFVEEKGWTIHNIYVDDGYSGLNFDRPGFKSMIEDIENNKISLIITKDMSRLGRDYIEVGYYLEKYFPERKIRYIAINDGIDTERDISSNDITPFKAIMNDMYSKDISKKVRSVFDLKRKAGKYIGSTAAYGYQKDVADKNKLVIDEEAAIVVKRIFDEYLGGKGYTAIARMLNAEGILCPAEYKRQKFGINVPGKEKFPQWCFSSVRSILNNPVYMGSLAQGKYKKASYKSKKLLAVDKQDWIVVENTHEPIVSSEEFHMVQDLMDNKNEYNDGIFRRGHKLFSNITYCGDCGERMIYHKTPSGYEYLICSTYKRYGKDYCTRHSIKEEKLENMIIQNLKEIFQKHADKRMLEEEAKNLSQNNFSPKQRYKQELRTIHKRLKEIDQMIARIYEDRIKGVIPQDKYLILDKGFGEEKANLTKRSMELEGKLQDNKQQPTKEERIEKLVDTVINVQELNKLILNQLVERIDVFEKGKIHINYRFKDIE